MDETVAVTSRGSAPRPPADPLRDHLRRDQLETVLEDPLPNGDRASPGPASLDDTLAATGDAPGSWELDNTLQDPSPALDAAASSVLNAGATVGRFVLLSELGAGGMGVVYAAYDPKLDRKVALKVIRGEMGWSAEARTRLLREAQAMAKLQHPNVVAVHDVGTHEDHVWIAMEFIKGQTLRAWLGARSRTWREVVRALRRAGHGVAAAHNKGLLHRDLKPDNIMVADDGRVRVMDFGLARSAGDVNASSDDRRRYRDNAFSTELTQFGAILGTPGYMAPEQFLGAGVDPRTDQFALY